MKIAETTTKTCQKLDNRPYVLNINHCVIELKLVSYFDFFYKHLFVYRKKVQKHKVKVEDKDVLKWFLFHVYRI